MISIYGIFTLADRCLYVGQSLLPHLRFRAHIGRGGILAGRKNLRVTILARVKTNQRAAVIEGRFIRKFQKNSQATYNKVGGVVNRRMKHPKYRGGDRSTPKCHIRIEPQNSRLITRAAALNGRSFAAESNHAIADHYLRLGIEKLKAQQV